MRTLNGEGHWNLDFSSGQQNYGVGTGMLIWQGAGNGFERGGLGILQRTAWTNATLAKLTFEGLSLEGFYLNPNELESNNTRTEMAGGVIQYRWSPKSRIGLSALKVLQSEQFYPLPSAPFPAPSVSKAAATAGSRCRDLPRSRVPTSASLTLGFVANSQPSEMTTSICGRMHFTGKLATASSACPSRRPSATALRHSAATIQTPPTGTSGSIRSSTATVSTTGSSVPTAPTIPNSNTGHHRVTLQAVLTQQDFVKFQYVRTFAPELSARSSSARPHVRCSTEGGLVLVNGVADPHLADEIYGEWTHVFSPNVTGALFASVARRGAGIRELPGIEEETWIGAGALVTVKY